MRKNYTIIHQQNIIRPEDIQESPSYVFNLGDISVDHYIDSPSYKTVTAYTKQVGAIVLWEGDAYDAIGQWTDSDVEARLLELFPQ
jgi:hypothetical protein